MKWRGISFEAQREKPLRRSERGVAAIEFALIAAPFFFVLFSILEMGTLLFFESRVQNAVLDASRLIRTGQAQAQNMTANQFRTAICNETAGLAQCEARLSVFVTNAADFKTLTPLVPALATVGPLTTTFAPGTAQRAVAVIATYQWTFVSPLMWVFSNVAGNRAIRRLPGIAVFQNEPFT